MLHLSHTDDYTASHETVPGASRAQPSHGWGTTASAICWLRGNRGNGSAGAFPAGALHDKQSGCAQQRRDCIRKRLLINRGERTSPPPLVRRVGVPLPAGPSSAPLLKTPAMLCATLPMSTPPRRRRPEGTCSTDMACDATTAAARAAARIARGAILISVEVLVEGNLPSYDRRGVPWMWARGAKSRKL